MIDLDKLYKDHVLEARAVVRAVVKKVNMTERIKHMSTLKSLYMDLLKSRVDVSAVLGEIERLVTSGKLEDKKRVQTLDAKLTAALSKEKQALASYTNAVHLSWPSNATVAGTMKRAKFDALSPEMRMEFIRAGGKVQD